MASKEYVSVLTIAGSDSSGGAGIQADLKTISACGGYGMSAITAITAQNTVGVQAIEGLSPAIVKAQIRSIIDDIGVDAIKIGMLHTPGITRAVADMLVELPQVKLILDPVMVATSGDRLLQEEAINALIELLIPKAHLITPNVPEAEILYGKSISAGEMETAAGELAKIHGVSFLLKGGHIAGSELVDLFYNAEQEKIYRFASERIETKNTHGTGCSLSSAIATYYAKGVSLTEAVSQGVDFIKKAIQAGKAYEIGKGSGPVHHFHAWW